MGCGLLDGVFEHGAGGQLQFRPDSALTPEAPAAIAAQVRWRVPHWFARSGRFDAAGAHDMLAKVGNLHDRETRNCQARFATVASGRKDGQAAR